MIKRLVWFFFVLLLLLSSCQRISRSSKVAPIAIKSENLSEYAQRNEVNLEYNAPFYILKKRVFLYNNPREVIPQAHSIELAPLSIVYAVLPLKVIGRRFLAKTINDEYGWVSLEAGIAPNYHEDSNLYYFSNAKPQYYESHYQETFGKVSNQYKLILYKNIIPMLLGNFVTDGWYYPVDIEFALELAQDAVKVARDQDTFFYASTMFDNWRINEMIIAMNLLADAYHKNGFLKEAVEIHELIIRKYFWKRSDNTQIGGLNSMVKLLKVYIDMAKVATDVSEEKKIREDIIKLFLSMDDSKNFFTVMDNEWNQTAAEWMITILENSFEPELFYEMSDIIRKRTDSIGLADLINVHKAISMYKNGSQEEAMHILVNTKSRIQYQRYLNLNDFISETLIIPDSIIYQYERF